MFAQTTGRAANPWTISVSIGLQAVMLSAAVILPLVRIEPLPMVQLQDRPRIPDHVKLIPVTAAARAVVSTIRSRLSVPMIRIPQAIPRSVPEPAIEDAPVIRDGYPSGAIGSVPGLLSSRDPIGAVAPPKPPEKPVEVAVQKPAVVAAKPLTIGGDVKSPILKSAPPPPYPPMARMTRVQGTVRLNGVISRDGTVKSLQLASGHPMLVEAAMKAVQQWLYEPARLNGQPVDVFLTIDVNFRLGQQ